ncbi:hypothetical protein [Streptomyces sp. NBC_00829]|uniref:hypothetical protein n=1 Tax=Streptomyces sp. NBC_00829 TaxID=2903679 RepID=UPI00386A8A70|nr:hypothetical protein OG293_24310 [Streptomyces sp. NBC_00829]
MQVLFLALGASRKRAVVEESAEIVARGGRAVVLVGAHKTWLDQGFEPGVELVTADELQARHLPLRLERLVLYRVPRLVVRVTGRGPLAAKAKRALKAYERRVAARVHRRVFMPLHRRVWPKFADRMVWSHFAPRKGPDLLVVADALSVPRAVQLTEAWESEGLAVPRVCYGIDSDVSPQTSAAR